MFSFGGKSTPSSCLTGGKRRTLKNRGSRKAKRSMKKRGSRKAKRSMKKRSMKKRSMKKRRSMKKGSASKTRRGRKNFITHKGDKDYNARGHRQVKRRSPYSRRR